MVSVLRALMLYAGFAKSCQHASMKRFVICAAQRALGKFRGVQAPSFLSVMDNVANLLRKPVRAR